jgi:hypothetical protein
MTDINTVDSVDKTFTEVFHERIDEINRRAIAAGITITQVCRESGAARATPDRWRKKAPKTIELIDEMEKVVVAAEVAKAGSAE